MSQPYIFSIVMAAYNAERYLTEAVDSLKEQTIGFDKVQLIIVDDGSKDQTAALADALAESYSNIQVLHKENGGASSARNMGLSHVQGRYINFMDSDDKLSPETLENVYNFFLEHENETDAVVIPMIYFDGGDEEHLLNFFRKETCVADLEEHPDYVAMSMSSTFVRAEAAKGIRFDTRLAYAEDARVLLPILLKKRTLGIVSEAVYWYRRHASGEVSATQNTRYNPKWYQPYLDYFCMGVINHCLETCGNVPAFIQYTLAYDLQLRLKVEHIPDSVMDKDAQSHYLDTLFTVYSYIDDAVLLAQKRTFAEHKLFMLKTKYQALPEFVKKKNNIQLYYGDKKIYDLKRSPVIIHFIQIKGTRCSIEGTINYFPSVMHEVKPYFIVNGKRHACRATDHNEDKYCLGNLVLRRQGFIGRFDIDPDTPLTTIQFMYMYDDMRVIPYKYHFKSFVPLDITFSTAYGIVGNYILRYENSSILLEQATPQTISEREAAFIAEVRASGEYSEEDILLREKARTRRLGRPIWLISDRYDQADDNGEALFIYLRKYHRLTVKSYFVLAKDAKDYDRLEKIGPVVARDSAEHKLLYLQASCIISSQANDTDIHPFAEQAPLYKDLTAQKPFVFLQHGVIKDDLSGWLNRYSKNLRGFITTAKPEYTSVCTPGYGYTEREVWLTGLARHDRLYNAPEKMITVMPTWRQDLLGALNAQGHWVALPGLEKSEYVVFYRNLFQNPRLTEAAERLGYTLAFKPHPNMIDFIPYFELPSHVKVPGRDVSYRDTFAKSDLVLTDYSSVVFDFAYLRKPILYYQGDRDSFFSGEHTYVQGYFDYERDGFGEITYTLEETVDQLISYMEDGCALKDKYRSRMDQFFAFNDRKCCKRTYKKIRNIK